MRSPDKTIMVPDMFGGAEHEVVVYDAAVMQFVSRIRKQFKLRKKWSRAGNIACYRLYDADLPEYAVAIDVYINLDRTIDSSSDTSRNAEQSANKLELLSLSDLTNEDLRERINVHVAEYKAPSKINPEIAEQRFLDIIAVIPDALGVSKKRVFTKVRKRDKGGSQYAENRSQYLFHTQETNLVFKVDMNGYLDTGLFLDHRITRELVEELSNGKRVLNLFAYTGSATVHAAAGGALLTVTVDLSQTYLDWARENMRINGFTGTNHLYQRADTMTWLKNAASKGYFFDLIFVDPPTFSNSKAMGKSTWDVQRDHLELLRRCEMVLSPNGTIIFSCNLRSFKLDKEGLENFGLTIRDITQETIPEDFKRNPRIHKCYVMKKRTP